MFWKTKLYDLITGSAKYSIEKVSKSFQNIYIYIFRCFPLACHKKIQEPNPVRDHLSLSVLIVKLCFVFAAKVKLVYEHDFILVAKTVLQKIVLELRGGILTAEVKKRHSSTVNLMKSKTLNLCLPDTDPKRNNYFITSDIVSLYSL